MKTIQVSDEMYDFLMETSFELNTQDNRHTDTPIFRIYENRKIERGEGRGEYEERLDYEGAEDNYCAKCQQVLEDNDYDFDKLPDIYSDECDCRYTTGATWHFDKELVPSASDYDGVAFLTEAAAEQYRKNNDYHFESKGVVYAESAFRNWELKNIISFLQSLNPPKYTTVDTFTIKDRGTVHTTDHNLLTNPRNLVGKDVLLDGKLVRVRGVEMFLVPYRKEDKTEKIGLLV